MLYLPVTESIRYHYDFNGNPNATVLPDGRQINYLYYGSDHLHQISLDDEVITDIERDRLHRKIYRTQGKLASRYELDPLGRLKNEEVSDGLEEETGFVWDGSHLLQEIHPDGRYTYLYTDPDSYEPLAQVRNWTNEDGENRQQIHYFHCDQIGIPREMTDDEGNLVWFGNYTGWGRLKEETKVTDSAYQPFRLQNQYADHETGLHYNFFRYYEPDAGRFVNQDPIGLLDGENLYEFSPNINS